MREETLEEKLERMEREKRIAELNAWADNRIKAKQEQEYRGQSGQVAHAEQLRPDYYDPESVYEPVKVIFAWDLGFCLGNVLKYIARAGKKSEGTALEDLKKARTYLDLQIQRMEQGK